jgi:hypothetical protein
VFVITVLRSPLYPLVESTQNQIIVLRYMVSSVLASFEVDDNQTFTVNEQHQRPSVIDDIDAVCDLASPQAFSSCRLVVIQHSPSVLRGGLSYGGVPLHIHNHNDLEHPYSPRTREPPRHDCGISTAKMGIRNGAVRSNI